MRECCNAPRAHSGGVYGRSGVREEASMLSSHSAVRKQSSALKIVSKRCDFAQALRTPTTESGCLETLGCLVLILDA